LERRIGRLGKFHGKPPGPKIAPELLSKEHFDIGFIVNNKNKKIHVVAPVLPSVAALRGRMIRNLPVAFSSIA